MVLYLRQEGRDIGLLNKVNAYALQDRGYDTVEANRMLGFKDDERSFEIAEYILHHYGIRAIRLVTNNPRKIAGLTSVEIVERLPCITEPNACNAGYLGTKKKKLGHLL
jgi:GTP cyclohydrolase II